MKLKLTERAFVPRSLRESTSQPQAANLDFAPEGYRPRGRRHVTERRSRPAPPRTVKGLSIQAFIRLIGVKFKASAIQPDALQHQQPGGDLQAHSRCSDLLDRGQEPISGWISANLGFLKTAHSHPRKAMCS
jgi:hypothetical protein